MDKEQIILAIKLFLEDKDYNIARTRSIAILSELNKLGFPAYESQNNNETPYQKIFNNYLEDFTPFKNPNSDSIGYIIQAIQATN